MYARCRWAGNRDMNDSGFNYRTSIVVPVTHRAGIPSRTHVLQGFRIN